MTESTGGGSHWSEKLTIRVLVPVLALYTGYLQTGQISLGDGQHDSDIDTVAMLKIVHQLDLRINRLEALISVVHGDLPGALTPPHVPGPISIEPPRPTTAMDIDGILKKARSMVSEEEVETLQQAR